MLQVTKPYCKLTALAALMLLPVLLLFGLQAVQFLLKETAELRAQNASRTTLLIDEAAVEWEENGRELKIDGRFFDIAHMERIGTQLRITGYFDDTETGVFGMLLHTMRNGLQHGLLSKLLLVLQCVAVLPVFELPVIHTAIQSPYSLFILHSHANPFIGVVPTPPWQ